MKLLALPTSPFAARVLIQAYEKDIPLEVVFPQPGEALEQFAKQNPFRKIPILIHGQERIIESAAIGEYLEDRYPLPSLRGADAMVRAHTRAFVHAVDLYLFPALFEFRIFKTGDPGVSAVVSRVDDALQRLQGLFDKQGYICGNSITLADCALAPAYFYLRLFLRRHGQESILQQGQVLPHWWDTVTKHASVSRMMAELDAAISNPP